MARYGVRPDWAKEMVEKITEHRFDSIVLSYNPAAQFVVSCAAENNVPVKITNLGAGVKRITAAEKVCPHCGGKGYLK